MATADSAPGQPQGPLFIVGADRSGTTLLRLYLDAHPDLAIPAESWFLPELIRAFPLGRKLTTAEQGAALAQVMSHDRWRHDWGSSAADYQTLVSDACPRTLAELVDALFRIETAASGAKRWGDKTPEYVSHVTQLSRLFPDARFVHIVRDGRDVCQSLLRKRWSERGWTPYQVARYWDQAVRAAAHDRETLGPGRFLHVAYEDLVLDTHSVLERVCSFVDLSFDPSMLAAHEHADAVITEREREKLVHTKLSRAPRADDVARWKREGSRVQLALCWPWLRHGLEHFGYEPSEPPLPDAVLRVASWIDYATSRTWRKLKPARQTLRRLGRR